MFASPLKATESFLVNVISSMGNILEIIITPDAKIDYIKTIAAKHFYGQSTVKSQMQFRLLHLTKLTSLSDNNSVEEENIKEHDELMLVELRPAMTKENLSEEALKGPNQDAITIATKGMSLRNSPRPVPTADQMADFQNEIRKILITLVETSAKLLNNSPEAAKIYEVIRERWETRCKPPNDPKIVKNLMDMGFSESRVLKALHLRKMNATEALEWLIEHADIPDVDDVELPFLETDFSIESSLASSSGPSGSGITNSSKKKSLKEACMDLFKGGNQSSKKETNLYNIVCLLLKSFKQHKKLEFKPDPRIIQSLMEMGFEEKKIVDALRFTGNDQSNACEWLLGERRPSLQDLDEGLDPEGLIYKAIMSNPHIQLSLTSPKMLLAYLSMLESPMSANVWINDPEASPVLSQIFKTYHAEKHAIHVNRYSDS